MAYRLKVFLCVVGIMLAASGMGQSITLVELNCENLFDCRDDEGKQDEEFLPDGARRWTPKRYWRKLNNIGQELLSCSDRLPDIVALVEVENDTVMHDLTRRSLLRNAGYHYLMTESPDVRGLDVALLFQPSSFRPLCYETIQVPTVGDMRPTRDILYVRGEAITGDTLHIFVVHSPSRYGGERQSRPYRRQVVQAMEPILNSCLQVADKHENMSQQHGNVIIVGDFNDYSDSPALKSLYALGMHNVTATAKGSHGAKGTYRYQGEWHSIDHVLVSTDLQKKVGTAVVNDANFLLEDEPRYGGKRPRRTYQGFSYRPAFSDHLPLVVTFQLR